MVNGKGFLMGKDTQLTLPYVGLTPRAQRAINAISKAEDAIQAEAERFAAEQALAAVEKAAAAAHKASCQELEHALNTGVSVYEALTGRSA